MNDRSLSRVESLLQEHIARLILRELDVEPGVLVTVTGVKASDDLKYATVKFTVFPEHFQGSVLAGLRKITGEIEYEVSDLLKRGRSPELSFKLDEGIIRGHQVEDLLDQLSVESDGSKPE